MTYFPNRNEELGLYSSIRQVHLHTVKLFEGLNGKLLYTASQVAGGGVRIELKF